MARLKLVSGQGNLPLSQLVSQNLKIPLTPIKIKTFADGEIYVRIEEKVRGDDVFLIQSMPTRVNDYLMEMLITIDALHRASAGRINVVCPYMGYSRQDRKSRSREPITAKLVANLITKAGADRLLTFDLHADQIQGFYDIPVDHLVGYPLFAKYLVRQKYKNMAVVAPDIGAVKKANKMATLLKAPLIIIDKDRPCHNQTQINCVIGDVTGKTAILLDDMIDTGGTISNAAQIIKEKGAAEVIICATHALLNGEAAEKLDRSPASKIIILDTLA
jgi:ribose-phosphate pyrophosphokinase